MVRTLLIRGMLVGILAGLLVFAFGKFVGEPQLDRALRFESATEEAKSKAVIAHGMHDMHAMAEPELVTRDVQGGIGLATGVVVYATAFGGLFALVFAVADRRIGDLSPRAVSALLAALGFVAVCLVPYLKYPPSPPAVGQAETIGLRTALYFTMLALSVAAMLAAVVLQKHLVSRHGSWHASMIAAGFYLLAVIVVAGVLPGIDEVPEAFPAAVLWKFRVASLGMQLILWTTLGLVFGELTERATPRAGWLAIGSPSSAAKPAGT